MAYNIDAETQIGKLTIVDKETDTDITEQFMNDLSSSEAITIGAKYANLPSASELIELFEEEIA